MVHIETLLARWRSLYAEWVFAELELRDARHRRPGSRHVAVLEARVRQLQEECQAALDETSAALATTRAHGGTSGEALEPNEVAA